jgi:CARDB
LDIKSIFKILLIATVSLTFICSILPYSEAHILIIGDSNNDIPTAYSEANSIATLLKSKGYPVLELYKENATTKNILKGMYGADAIIYAGHGGYIYGNYNLKGGSATPPFALVGSNDFIWGIGNKMREGFDGKLFTAPVKNNIPVILLESCFSTGWVDNHQVSNPTSTIYNFASMFIGSGANYYASAWTGEGLDLVKSLISGEMKNFAEYNSKNEYEKIVKSTLYNNTNIWRNSGGYSSFVGNWLGTFPKVLQTTKYNDSAAELWYNSDRSKNPYQSDLTVSEVVAPKNGIKGLKINVLSTIKNLVNAASSSFYVNFYLKKNSTSKNIYIGQTFIPSIGSLSNKHLNTTLILPTSLTAANYNILVYADPYNTNPETNKSNNYKLSSSRISIHSAYKDLVVTGIGANINGYSGNKLYLSNTVKNIGTISTSSFWVHYYLKKKGYVQSKYIGQHYFSGLDAGKSKTLNTTIKLSSSIVAKNYYISAYVDAHKDVSESNEKNNYKIGTIKSV